MHVPGLVQWFRFGEEELLADTIELLNELSVSEFRVLCSWADWEREGGKEWFDTYLPALGNGTRARLILNPFYTPLPLARKDEHGEARTSHPPRDLESYAVFIGELIGRYGRFADWVQIWNEPNWTPYWNEALDPGWELFAAMARAAAREIHARGKRAALGGLSPYEPQWIYRMYELGVMLDIDAVGIHFSPSWSSQRRRWFGWETELASARAHLSGIGSRAELWIAETGYATLASAEYGTREAESEQIRYFDAIRALPADKILWYCAFDQEKEHATDDALNMGTSEEQAAYHLGLRDAEKRWKPLFFHWKRLADQSRGAHLPFTHKRLNESQTHKGDTHA